MGSTDQGINQHCGAGLAPVRARSRGFVLAEVLVVAVIVAILSLVAIPLYSGFITHQKEQAAMAVAQTAAITAGSYFRRTGLRPTKDQLNLELSIPNAAQFNIYPKDTLGGHKVVVFELSNPGYAALVPY